MNVRCCHVPRETSCIQATPSEPLKTAFQDVVLNLHSVLICVYGLAGLPCLEHPTLPIGSGVHSAEGTAAVTALVPSESLGKEAPICIFTSDHTLGQGLGFPHRRHVFYY